MILRSHMKLRSNIQTVFQNLNWKFLWQLETEPAWQDHLSWKTNFSCQWGCVLDDLFLNLPDNTTCPKSHFPCHSESLFKTGFTAHVCRGWNFPCLSQISLYWCRVKSGMKTEMFNTHFIMHMHLFQDQLWAVHSSNIVKYAMPVTQNRVWLHLNYIAALYLLGLGAKICNCMSSIWEDKYICWFIL